MAERYGALPPDTAQLTTSEIRRLKRGAELNEEAKERAAERGSAPSADQRRREEQKLQEYA